jgi:hypothetical protein
MLYMPLRGDTLVSFLTPAQAIKDRTAGFHTKRSSGFAYVSSEGFTDCNQTQERRRSYLFFPRPILISFISRVGVPAQTGPTCPGPGQGINFIIKITIFVHYLQQM